MTLSILFIGFGVQPTMAPTLNAERIAIRQIHHQVLHRLILDSIVTHRAHPLILPTTLAHIHCFVKPPSCRNDTYVSNFARNFYTRCALAGKTKFWAGGLAAARPGGLRQSAKMAMAQIKQRMSHISVMEARTNMALVLGRQE